jgi:hypothetical protein
MKMKSLLVIILSALVFASGAYAQNIGDSGLETGRRMKIGKAADVDSTDKADGKVLAWDETSGKFVYTTSSGGSGDSVWTSDATEVSLNATESGKTVVMDGSASVAGDLTVDGKVTAGSIETLDVGTLTVNDPAVFNDIVTMASNLSVDGTTLVVDADNNRVGIGEAVPDANFQVKGTGTGTDKLVNFTDGSDNDVFTVTEDGKIACISGTSSVIIGSGAGAADDGTDNANTFVGYDAGSNNTTGVSNSFVGGYAGRYQVDGTTDLTVTSNSVFIGYNTKGTQSATNENVFGYEAEGKGSNTVVLGNDDITATYLKGTIVLEDITLGISNLTIDNGEIYINGVQKTGL